MRTFLRYHVCFDSSSSILTQLTSTSRSTYLLHLEDGESSHTPTPAPSASPSSARFEELIQQIDRVIELKMKEIDHATLRDKLEWRLIVQRREAETRPSSSHGDSAGEPLSNFYRVESSEDTRAIQKNDLIHCIGRINEEVDNGQSLNEPHLLEEQLVEEGFVKIEVQMDPRTSSIKQFLASVPCLSSVESQRRRALHSSSSLLNSDEGSPDCSVARDEPSIDVGMLEAMGALPWLHLERQTTATTLRQLMERSGFIRLQFPAGQMGSIQQLHQVQREFFALPFETKEKFAPFHNVESEHQIPFGYSCKKECHKEFYVFRQLPPNSELTYPDEPPRFVEDVSNVYNMFGRICLTLMELLLQGIGVTEEKAKALLKDCMAPPKSMFDLPCTSVIELFKYDDPAQSAQQSSMASSSSSSSSTSAPGSSSSPRPPFPCSYHSDASLLTLIPRCLGRAGLQIWNPYYHDWQAVESQSELNEGIVFVGDMFARVTNDAIMPTQHRVAFGQDLSNNKQESTDGQPSTATDDSSSSSSSNSPSSSDVRYSCPFELFLAPSTTVDCQDLLANSSESELKQIRPSNASVMSAQQALLEISRNRKSVNQTSV